MLIELFSGSCSFATAVSSEVSFKFVGVGVKDGLVCLGNVRVDISVTLRAFSPELANIF